MCCSDDECVSFVTCSCNLTYSVALDMAVVCKTDIAELTPDDLTCRGLFVVLLMFVCHSVVLLSYLL